MRIIAGRFKGRRLYTPAGRQTRPTPGKVREAIFNICASAVPSACVADLFSGTGAMGIEALSRGARHAVFIDSDTKACRLIKNNLALCRAEDRAAVLCRDLLRGPGTLSGPNSIFNLVFMDPPYNRGALAPALENLLKSGTLAPGAVMVIEHAPTEPVPKSLPGLDVFDVRRYGKTLVTFMSYMVANI
ncbi:MAG: 16S rRNA (guanine(966)-N(2))-methyltransferase RsmD [Desulfobacteraceae bacterium]|nr:16S rRNA (guanine(966)-N(2))-methyltransferase RsmD [Desulfobacteraceae bacterium]